MLCDSCIVLLICYLSNQFLLLHSNLFIMQTEQIHPGKSREIIYIYYNCAKYLKKGKDGPVS